MVLIQEQLSKNRIIVELDGNKNVTASVTSSTHERKSRTNVVMTHGRIRLKHNSLTENVPIVIAFKAMGFTSDQEIVGLVGTELEIQDALAASLEEAAALKVFSQRQALAYIGSKIKSSRGRMGRSARTRDPVVRTACRVRVCAWEGAVLDGSVLGRELTQHLMPCGRRGLRRRRPALCWSASSSAMSRSPTSTSGPRRCTWRA